MEADSVQLNELIPLTEACRLLPKRNGRHPSLASLRRWAASGIRGKRLRAARVGGRYYTTREWLEQFILTTDSPDYSGVQLPGRREQQEVYRLLITRGCLGSKAKKDYSAGKSIDDIQAERRFKPEAK